MASTEPGFGEPPEKLKLASPVNWWKLDAAEQVATLDVVSEFAVELVARYGLKVSVIPPCWFLHEPLIQELLALFQYRNQQQFMEIAPPGAPHEFHYQFQFTVARLTGWTRMTGCTEQKHTDTPLPAWVLAGTEQAAKYEAELESRSAALLRQRAEEEAAYNEQ